MTKTSATVEPSPYEALILEGLALERAIKRTEKAAEAARFRAYAAVWAFADWLVENVIVLTPSQAVSVRNGAPPPGLNLSEYARRSGCSVSCVSSYRKMALTFPPDVRPPGTSVGICVLLLREFKGDAAAAADVLPDRVARAQAAFDEARTKALAGQSQQSRLRGAVTKAERMTARSFSDAAELLTASARFAVLAASVVNEIDLSDSERATLMERVSRIDEALAAFPVERPKRRRFPWLKAAA